MLNQSPTILLAAAGPGGRTLALSLALSQTRPHAPPLHVSHVDRPYCGAAALLPRQNRPTDTRPAGLAGAVLQPSWLAGWQAGGLGWAPASQQGQHGSRRLRPRPLQGGGLRQSEQSPLPSAAPRARSTKMWWAEQGVPGVPGWRAHQPTVIYHRRPITSGGGADGCRPWCRRVVSHTARCYSTVPSSAYRAVPRRARRARPRDIGRQVPARPCHAAQQHNTCGGGRGRARCAVLCCALLCCACCAVLRCAGAPCARGSVGTLAASVIAIDYQDPVVVVCPSGSSRARARTAVVAVAVADADRSGPAGQRQPTILCAQLNCTYSVQLALSLAAVISHPPRQRDADRAGRARGTPYSLRQSQR